MIGVLETTDRLTVGTIVVVTRIYVRRIEVQVPRVVRIGATTRTRRPIVGVGSSIVDLTVVVIAVTCNLGDDWICV